MRTYEEEPSLGQLVSRLTEQATTLVREEVELAKTELASNAKRAGKGAGLVAAGAALGYAGLLAMIASWIILLALVLKLWIAALIVTGLVLGLAGLLVALGIQQMKRDSLAPKHTLQTIREDVEWAKMQTK